MKKLIAISLLVSQLAFGAVFTQRIDMSSTNIGPSFATGVANHLTFSNAKIVSIDAVQWDNRTANELWLNCSVTGVTVPADAAVNNLNIGSQGAWSTPDKAGFGNTCYLRSNSGTLSSGIVVVTVIGRAQ